MMHNETVEFTFKSRPFSLIWGILGFIIFSIAGLMLPISCSKCPHSTSIEITGLALLGTPFFLTAIAVATLSVFGAFTVQKVYATHENLEVDVRFLRWRKSLVFQKDSIRSIELVVFETSDSVPPYDYEIVLNLWLESPCRLGDKMDKDSSLILAKSLSELYDIPFVDHGDEAVLFPDVRSTNFPLEYTGAVLEKVRRRIRTFFHIRSRE